MMKFLNFFLPIEYPVQIMAILKICSNRVPRVSWVSFFSQNHRSVDTIQTVRGRIIYRGVNLIKRACVCVCVCVCVKKGGRLEFVLYHKL